MNKTKRNAWHKHLKKARKDHEKAVLARPGRAAVSSAPAASATRPSPRAAGSTSRPATPRP